MFFSKHCFVVTSSSIDNFSYLRMDLHNGMVEAIFLKWPHICKDCQSRGEAFCIWKLCLPACFENARARTSDISVILSKRQKYGKRKLKPHNGFPTPRKEIVACGLQIFFSFTNCRV